MAKSQKSFMSKSIIYLDQIKRCGFHLYLYQNDGEQYWVKLKNSGSLVQEDSFDDLQSAVNYFNNIMKERRLNSNCDYFSIEKTLESHGVN